MQPENLCKKAFDVLEKNPKEALKLFFDAYKFGGNSQAEASFGIALSMGRLNLHGKAVPFLKNALTMEPKNSIYNLNLGLYLKIIGKRVMYHPKNI